MQISSIQDFFGRAEPAEVSKIEKAPVPPAETTFKQIAESGRQPGDVVQGITPRGAPPIKGDPLLSKVWLWADNILGISHFTTVPLADVVLTFVRQGKVAGGRALKIR